jgi:hypothetical protein
MMVPAMTGPTPNTLVTVVPEALTAAVSFLLVSRSWASSRRMPARNSAASSQRARAAAPVALNDGPKLHRPSTVQGATRTRPVWPTRFDAPKPLQPAPSGGHS